MSEYKRYTEKRNGKNVIPLLKSVYGEDLPYWAIETESDIRQNLSGDAVNRLAELENDLESGKLVRLPCRVGTKVYRVWTYYNGGGYIQEYTIVKVEIYEEETLFFDDSDNQIEVADFGETVFLTRAEAEKELAELEKYVKD